MTVVRCKVEWESDGWAYIELQGGSELRYTKIPASIIVTKNDESYIYVERMIEFSHSWKCVLSDVRYKDYDFIRFNISKDQFVEDRLIETETAKLYKKWCMSVYRHKMNV